MLTKLTFKSEELVIGYSSFNFIIFKNVITVIKTTIDKNIKLKLI